jgi:plasmid stabilization system protein ParE
VGGGARGCGHQAAADFTEAFEAWCEALSERPESGRRRDDLFPGLRFAGFSDRVAVAYHLGLDTVTIDAILGRP